MATTTVGRVLLKFFVPSQFHHLVEDKILDKKGISNLFAELADKIPDQYSKIVSDLNRLGFEIATRQGTSITLKDLVSPINKDKLWDEFEHFRESVEKSNDGRGVKDKKIFDKYNDMMSGIEKDILAKGLAENKSLAKIILAGSRGSPAQYRGTIATQGIVVDAEGKAKMDLPIKSSYAEGLSLPEYLTTSYGARSGEVLKKVSVAQGGYGCLSSTCNVLLSNYSEKSIADVQVGDLILGADAKGNIFPVTVTAKFESGIKPVWRYTFRSLNSSTKTKQIDCTEDHKILCKNARDVDETYQIPAGKIKIGGKAAGEPSAVLPTSVKDYGTYNNHALFLGLMLGGGCWTKSTNTTPHFSCGDPVLIEDISKYFNSLNLELSKSVAYNYVVRHFTPIKKITVGNKQYTGHPTINWLRDINLLGTDSYTKFIPEECKSWNKKAICELLAGLFATDGTFKYAYDGRHHFTITITLCAKQVIESMQWLLEKRLGIETSAIRAGKSKYKGRIYGDTYRLTISNSEMVSRFISLIDVPGVKKNTLKLFKEKLQEVQNSYAPCKLITKTFLGDLPTYDIEVDHPDHLFLLSSGLIVSNSKQFARALMPLQVVESDCDTSNGIDMPVSDRESIGAHLAKAVGGYNRNNEVTAKMLNDLKTKNIAKITIRSPMTCQSNKKHHSGGLCQMCVGKREKGMAALDSYIGLVAGTAVAEPLTESAMKARHCLFSNTLVAYPCPDDNKTIKDVKVGDTIIGATTAGKLLPTKVLAVIDQGIQDVYRHTFRYGKTNETFSVEATEDHIVLGGTYNCHNLSKNNPELLKIGTKHKKFHMYLGRGFDDSLYTNNEPYAFLLGLLLGDGSYTTEKGTVQYYNFDTTSIQHIQNKLYSLGLKLAQNAARASQYSVTTITNESLVPTFSATSCFGVVHKNPARLKLEELGMWGKVHHEKTIPTAAYTWTNEAIAELLSGLFYTDGSVNFDKDKSKNTEQTFKSYSYFSASKKLVSQIKYFLETRFGIYTSAITTSNKKGKTYNIDGREGTCKHNSYGLRIRRPEAVQRFDEVVKLFGAKFDKCQNVEFYKAKDLNREYYRCNIVSVEHLGAQHCYDLTVDCPDNLFMLASGAIVHNSGGAATSLGGNQGFKLINQLANVPKTFVGRAPIAQEDGFITKLEPAAAGGHFISVNNEEHYIGVGQDPKFKQGDRVEQGQVLSTGLVDPREVVKYRGIGDGRKYYMEAMKKAFDDSGLGVNRRNFELIAKAAIDHVKITDPHGIGDYLPDQVVSYSAIEKDYKARPEAKELRLDLAYGKYLEKPELHYTIGTKVTTAVIEHLKEHGIESVLVCDTHPHFEPTMVRLVDVPEHHDDWMHVLNSTNLAKRFVNMVNRGATSDLKGSSPIPGLAYGVNFGKKD
jgi:hypothetical protein